MFSTIVTIPLMTCLVLVWLGRDELGTKGIFTCLLICASLMLGCAFLRIPTYVFFALLSFFDIALLLALFGHDIHIK